MLTPIFTATHSHIAHTFKTYSHSQWPSSIFDNWTLSCWRHCALFSIAHCIEGCMSHVSLKPLSTSIDISIENDPTITAYACHSLCPHSFPVLHSLTAPSPRAPSCKSRYTHTCPQTGTRTNSTCHALSQDTVCPIYSHAAIMFLISGMLPDTCLHYWCNLQFSWSSTTSRIIHFHLDITACKHTCTSFHVSKVPFYTSYRQPDILCTTTFPAHISKPWSSLSHLLMCSRHLHINSAPFTLHVTCDSHATHTHFGVHPYMYLVQPYLLKCTLIHTPLYYYAIKIRYNSLSQAFTHARVARHMFCLREHVINYKIYFCIFFSYLLLV